jgi:hypothetical protein
MINNQKPNYAKYKWVIPFAYCLVFFLILAGPTLFPIIFLKVCNFVNYYGVLRVFYMAICSIIGLYKFLTLPKYTRDDPEADVIYAWVLPNYKEDEKILGATLKQLAKHSRAQEKYIVMLAMEAH